MRLGDAAAAICVVAVIFFAALTISPSSTAAIGKLSDISAAGFGGCDPGNKYDPNLKYPETEEKTGKVGLIGLPCYDTTNGFTTKGTCIAADVCLAASPKGLPTLGQMKSSEGAFGSVGTVLTQSSGVTEAPPQQFPGPVLNETTGQWEGSNAALPNVPTGNNAAPLIEGQVANPGSADAIYNDSGENLSPAQHTEANAPQFPMQEFTSPPLLDNVLNGTVPELSREYQPETLPNGQQNLAGPCQSGSACLSQENPTFSTQPQNLNEPCAAGSLCLSQRSSTFSEAPTEVAPPGQSPPPRTVEQSLFDLLHPGLGDAISNFVNSTNHYVLNWLFH